MEWPEPPAGGDADEIRAHMRAALGNTVRLDHAQDHDLDRGQGTSRAEAQPEPPRYGPHKRVRLARELEILKQLSHAPDTASGLCRRLGTHRTNRVIHEHRLGRLERDGHIRKVKRNWTITERGKRRLERLEELKAEGRFRAGERAHRGGGRLMKADERLAT
jgi:hypothetical protein